MESVRRSVSGGEEGCVYHEDGDHAKEQENPRENADADGSEEEIASARVICGEESVCDAVGNEVGENESMNARHEVASGIYAAAFGSENESFEGKETDVCAAAHEEGNGADHQDAAFRVRMWAYTIWRLHTPPLEPHPLSLVLFPRSSSKPPLPPLPRPRPRPRPPPRASRSEVRTSSNRARRSRSSMARVSPALTWRISCFFSSTNVRGTPAGES